MVKGAMIGSAHNPTRLQLSGRVAPSLNSPLNTQTYTHPKENQDLSTYMGGVFTNIMGQSPNRLTIRPDCISRQGGPTLCSRLHDRQAYTQRGKNQDISEHSYRANDWRSKVRTSSRSGSTAVPDRVAPPAAAASYGSGTILYLKNNQDIMEV